MERTPTNAQIAAALRRLADLLEIQGDPIFRVNAYRRAADGIDNLTVGLAVLRGRGELRTIPGVGSAIEDKIEDLLDTGRLRQLDALEREIPSGVADLLTVPDIGPKRAGLLYQHLGIDSLEGLRIALAAAKVAAVPGIGPKNAERIAAGLASMIAESDRFPLPLAWRLGMDAIERLRAKAPSIAQIELAGSIRRCRETIGDIDIVAAAPDPERVVAAFADLDGVARIEMRGQNRCRVHLEQGLPADLRVLPEESWGSLLHHFTGNKAHDVRLRDMALARGARLSEYGIQTDGQIQPCATEDEVYAFFGMPFIPPPMREDTGELELALKHELPPVVELGDLRGDLHSHSIWSDGALPIEEMALAAQGRGYEYLCITDHSRGLTIANGLGPERLAAQRQEIDALNTRLAPFRVLQGCEVDVRADGSLDLPDDVLTTLDIVLASVHSGLTRGRESVTERALAAIRHPLVDVLTHPTGRVLGGRAGGDFDIEALTAEAAKTGTILEINGSVMDLRDTHARIAIEAGCTVGVNSDGHSAEGLDSVRFAVGVAQRAWIPPKRVANTLPLERLLKMLKRNRR